MFVAKLAAIGAFCVGLAACAPFGTDRGYPASYGDGDAYRYSRYDGSAYNYSDGSDPNFNNYRYSRGGANGGYDVAPPPRTESNPSYYRGRGGRGDRYDRSYPYPSRDY